MRYTNKIGHDCLPADMHQVDRYVITDAHSNRLSNVGHARSNVAKILNPSFVKHRLNVKNTFLVRTINTSSREEGSAEEAEDDRRTRGWRGANKL